MATGYVLKRLCC